MFVVIDCCGYGLSQVTASPPFPSTDLTAVCMIEGFNNPNWMMQADRVLKEIGKEKAQEYCKV